MSKKFIANWSFLVFPIMALFVASGGIVILLQNLSDSKKAKELETYFVCAEDDLKIELTLDAICQKSDKTIYLAIEKQR